MIEVLKLYFWTLSLAVTDRLIMTTLDKTVLAGWSGLQKSMLGTCIDLLLCACGYLFFRLMVKIRGRCARIRARESPLLQAHEKNSEP